MTPKSLVIRSLLNAILAGVGVGLGWFTITPTFVVGYYPTLLLFGVVFSVAYQAVEWWLRKVFRFDTKLDMVLGLVANAAIPLAAFYFLLPGHPIEIVHNLGTWIQVPAVIVFFGAINGLTLRLRVW